MKTRYWGLYNWETKRWVLNGTDQKRKAFAHFSEALHRAFDNADGTGPRPFYVVRKAKKEEMPEDVVQELGACVYNADKIEDFVKRIDLETAVKFAKAISSDLRTLLSKYGRPY
jgi:hypothetical protein